MFEELPMDSSIGKFADRLKETFEAGDWKAVGITAWSIPVGEYRKSCYDIIA